jgi:hypothetical protein
MSERTYPFSLDTLGKIKQTDHSISLNCNVCNKHSMLDTDKLIERFGADHGCLDKDLRPYFYCRRCREAGRKDRDFTFTLHTPGPKEGPYARASRGQ